jgi:hypothetical protein
MSKFVVANEEKNGLRSGPGTEKRRRSSKGDSVSAATENP